MNNDLQPDNFHDMVLGFAFSPDFKRVVLISKERPDWQKGKLNGVGGKIKHMENAFRAMSREFKEETGVETEPTSWINYEIMQGKDWIVYCFYTVIDVDLVKSLTDEDLVIFRRTDFGNKEFFPMLSNLYWLIPMAVDHATTKNRFYNTTRYLGEENAID